MRDAENLLARCLELAPGFTAARHNYALVLHRQNKAGGGTGADRQPAAARAAQPGLPQPEGRRARRASASTTQAHRALRGHARASTRSQAKIWLSYGHALKTAGRQQDSIAAYRKSIELAPRPRRGLVEPREPEDVPLHAGRPRRDARAARAQPDLDAEDRFHFHFALGKALEDARRLRRVLRTTTRKATGCAGRGAATTPTTTTDPRARVQGAVHPRVLRRSAAARAAGARSDLHRRPAARGLDAGRADPGQPLGGRGHHGAAGHRRHRRASSSGRKPSARDVSKYPEVLGDAGRRTHLRALGERYLQQTRIQRKTGAPFFIDKMPNNWAHVGLIHLILPNARIIDARRHPLGCCFSGFKQHFARGQNFTYSLDDIGRYYRDYVELMAHFDAVLPGRVHRVIYERMVDDTEAEVRRLLDYCGLPFEDACLRVLRERAGGAHGELRAGAPADLPRCAWTSGATTSPGWTRCKDALGPVLDAYPAAPTAAMNALHAHRARRVASLEGVRSQNDRVAVNANCSAVPWPAVCHCRCAGRQRAAAARRHVRPTRRRTVAAASRRSSSPRRSARKTCRTCRSASRPSAPSSWRS